jgi:hypothetical protein
MSVPHSDDWRFDLIAKVEPKRAARLEGAPTDFCEIVALLKDALSIALAQKLFHCGTDFYQGNQRAIFQFQISPEIYDYFFNSRASYRAQYWISTEQGQSANAKCLKALATTILPVLPDRFEAREIYKNVEDCGGRVIERAFFEASFDHAASKIWIGENLINRERGVLPKARYDGPNLVVSRWTAPRAPYPRGPSNWMDLKGGFLGGTQPKDPAKRALLLHQYGWT